MSAGPIIVGMRVIERSIESSCVECNAAVLVISGHSVDACIICDNCAAEKLEDHEGCEERLEHAYDSVEARIIVAASSRNYLVIERDREPINGRFHGRVTARITNLAAAAAAYDTDTKDPTP